VNQTQLNYSCILVFKENHPAAGYMSDNNTINCIHKIKVHLLVFNTFYASN